MRSVTSNIIQATGDVLEDVVVLLVELVDDVLVDEDDVELDVVLLDVVLVDEVSVCMRHWDSKHQRTSEFRQGQNRLVHFVSITLHVMTAKAKALRRNNN